MEVEIPDDDELAGTPDIGGGDDPIDLDDTNDFYQEVNDDDIEDKVEPDDHEMVAMMDVLQTLGVEPEDANRFSSRIMRISSQPLNPSFVENVWMWQHCECCQSYSPEPQCIWTWCI